MRRAIPLALLLALGCGGDQDELVPFPVVFVARADAMPLAGVRITLDTDLAGTTGPDGTLGVLVHGREGESLRVRTTCPIGYRPTNEQVPPLVLRRVRSLDDPDSIRPLVIHLGCAPTEREVVVLVRAGLEGIPVRVDGRELARTDGDGLAHVPLRVPAPSQIEVVLWTASQPELIPSNPTRVFSIERTEELFVLDQRFETRAPPRPPRPTRPRPRPTRPLPVKVR